VKLPPAVAGEVARAFAHTFWWAVFTICIAFVPTLFLPSKGSGAAGRATPEDGDDVILALDVTAVE
jgi:hypothetical protein